MGDEVELLAALEFIRDTEARKSVDEMDVDLITECVDFILELTEKDIKLDENEVKNRVDKIFGGK